MTNQLAFETIARHLLTQRARSERQSRPESSLLTCRYRGDVGRKCAVGAIIPDSVYRPEMEGLSPRGLRSDFGLFRGLDLPLLRDCQVIHDDLAIESWREALREVGHKHRLAWPADL